MEDFHRERCKTDKGMIWNDLIVNIYILGMFTEKPYNTPKRKRNATLLQWTMHEVLFNVFVMLHCCFTSTVNI